MRVAKAGLGLTFRELWEDMLPSEVYRLYALAIASEYDQQLTERDVPKRTYTTDEDDDAPLPDFA